MWTSTEKRLSAKEQNHVKVVVEEVADVAVENKAGVEWEMEAKAGTKTRCMGSKVMVVADMVGKVTTSPGISRDMGDSSKDMVTVNKAGDNRVMVSKGNKDMVNKRNKDMANRHNKDMVNKDTDSRASKVMVSKANRDTVSKVILKEDSKVMVNKDGSKMVK